MILFMEILSTLSMWALGGFALGFAIHVFIIRKEKFDYFIVVVMLIMSAMTLIMGFWLTRILLGLA